MKRWVYAYTVVHHDPKKLDELLRSDVAELLVGATDSDPTPRAVDGSFVVHLSATVVGLQAGKDVRVRTGVAEQVDGRTTIGVSWAAETAPHAFPAFDGVIELQPLSSRHAQLGLAGSYRVPFGVAGMVIDQVLRGVGERTVRVLVDRLGEQLAHRASGEEPVEGVPIDDALPGSLRVWDVMTSDPMVFDEHMPLRTAAQLLVHRRVQGAPVVSASGGLIGVVSERDLLEKEAPLMGLAGRDDADIRRRRSAVTVGEACSRPARVTIPEASLRDAAGAMLDHDVARLVVVDGSEIRGILTRYDVLTAFLRSDAQLRAAAEQRLATLDEGDVDVHVAWGEATLGGTVSTRSRLPSVRQAVREIDGIVAVRGQPRWREDDTVFFAPDLVGP